MTKQLSWKKRAFKRVLRVMKKSKYLKEIVGGLNLDGTTTCEVCGKDSMIVHGFVDHDQETVKIICNDCYVKRLNRGEN